MSYPWKANSMNTRILYLTLVYYLLGKSVELGTSHQHDGLYTTELLRMSAAGIQSHYKVAICTSFTIGAYDKEHLYN